MKLVYPLLAMLGLSVCAGCHVRSHVDSGPLMNMVDSLSYAAGRSDALCGLRSYLDIILPIDSSCHDDFVDGFKYALAHRGDKSYEAYLAGQQAVDILYSDILPLAENGLDIVDFNRDAFVNGAVALITDSDKVFTDSAALAFYKAYADSAARSAKAEAEAFFLRNACEPDIMVTPSGVQYKIVTMGSGDTPKLDDTVRLRYRITNLAGDEIDDSAWVEAEGLELPVSALADFMAENIMLMSKGSARQLYVRCKDLYGDGHTPKGITLYSVISVELWLLDIV